MEQKKYELTKETMCFDGVTLHNDAKQIIVNASVTVGCDALCLNRICFKSEKRAKQFGEQFIDLFKQILLK